MESDKWCETEITNNGKKYKAQRIFPSGNSVKLELECAIFDRVVHCNVYFTTAHKHKKIDDTYLKLNGKDGVYPLIWAKRKLIEFEDIIKEDFSDKKIIIYVCWDDNRRRDVYHRGLKNIGYKFGNIGGCKCLFKVLDKC